MYKGEKNSRFSSTISTNSWARFKNFLEENARIHEEIPRYSDEDRDNRLPQNYQLPESFRQFSSLSNLVFKDFWELESLPESFGSLSSSSHLVFERCGRLQSLPESFGSLSSLSHLVFESCGQLQFLPESFGSLSSLSHLVFKYCGRLQSLPESFGSLSSLSHLVFKGCLKLQSLPESFGSLSSLSYLVFEACWELQSLPESFGSLSSLSHLVFEHCSKLQSLPESFGSLSSLSHLVFKGCLKLQSLPESFGSLSSLSHLVFESCGQLQFLPESFGSLSSLSYLVFEACWELQSLPESFGSLSSLSHLVFENCSKLQSLPESFGSLSSLSHLVFKGCLKLQSLPESFGSLSSLSHLVFESCGQLQFLPESSGSLSSLSHLVFEHCSRLQSLPESFGSLSSLSHLVFKGCLKLQSLPESFGSLSSLSYLVFEACWELQSLPESFGSLSSLSHLVFEHCSKLQSLPESFGSLSSLSHLLFENCGRLQSLPKSFKSLSSSSRLDIDRYRPLRDLSTSIWRDTVEGPSSSLKELYELDFNQGILKAGPDDLPLDKSTQKQKKGGAEVKAGNFEKETSLNVKTLSTSTEGELALEGTPNSEAKEPEIWENTEDIIMNDMDSDSKVRAEEPGCDLINATEELSELVRKFIAEIKKGDEGGFIVSVEWLYNLEEHEKEVLMRVLSGTGYSEVYHATTTILYQSLDQDNVETSNVTVYSDPASAGFVKKPLEEEIRSSILDTDREASTHSKLSTLQGKEELTVEQVSTSMRSFIAALNEKGCRSYCVSTEWVSNLQSYEKEMLESVCMETGFMKTYRNDSTTYYERVEDHVRTCNDGSGSDAKNESSRPLDSPSTSGAYKEVGELDFKELQSLSINDGLNSPPLISVATEPRPKSPHSECISQLFRVSYTPLRRSRTGASTSSSQDGSGTSTAVDSQYSEGEFRHCVRELCGDNYDNYVILPKLYRSKQDYMTIPTTVEKLIEIELLKYRGKTELIALPVNLKAVVETIVSCCLKNDPNRKKLRVKFSKIRGEVLYCDKTKPKESSLVLQSVYINVDAFIKSDNEIIELDPRPPSRIVNRTYNESDGIVDQVWVELSTIDVEDSESGSITVELKCDERKRRHLALTDLGLRFQDSTDPVMLEGNIHTPLDCESVLELGIRFRLRLSFPQPWQPSGLPYCRTKTAYQDIDFDCRLELTSTVGLNIR